MLEELDTACGAVVALWRYPVKSMMGEELNAATFGARGMIGDRAYAILDPETGKVASAKNPKKWPNLFDCRAIYSEPPQDGRIPPISLSLPDGSVASSVDADIDLTLTAMLGRSGILRQAVPDEPILEEYWPDMAELDHRDVVTDEAMPPGTFFDLAPVHLLTTGTIDALRAAYPTGRFEVRRFRPNIVIDTGADAAPFPEGSWVGRTLAIGEVRLRVTADCPRCVMTTLPQGDLPRDPGILRAAAQHNAAHVGIYAEVLQGGIAHRGDRVTLDS